MAERKIGKREFMVGTVLATEAVALQVRLLKLIGGGVDRLPTILKGFGDDADPEAKTASNAAALAAFTDIFANADPEEMTKLVQDIVGFATIKRPSGAYEKVDLDGDFTEEKGALFPVCVFVLQEVLGDFFTGLRDSGNLKKLARVV